MVAPSRNYQYNKKYKDVYRNKIHFCECGAEVKNGSIYSHKKSLKHIKFINLPIIEKEFTALNYISLEIFAKKISI